MARLTYQIFQNTRTGRFYAVAVDETGDRTTVSKEERVNAALAYGDAERHAFARGDKKPTIQF